MPHLALSCLLFCNMSAFNFRTFGQQTEKIVRIRERKLVIHDSECLFLLFYFLTSLSLFLSRAVSRSHHLLISFNREITWTFYFFLLNNCLYLLYSTFFFASFQYRSISQSMFSFSLLYISGHRFQCQRTSKLYFTYIIFAR